MSIFAVDHDKCNFCGLCAVECPAAIIVIKEPEALPFMARGGQDFCINCGHCVAVCPPGAISLETMKPEDCAAVRKEYYNNPEATVEAFRGGWFHSTDLVRQDEDGYIYVVGRKKDVIISGGENIYPEEIENVLGTHPKILESAVIGVPDKQWGENVKAIVVTKPGEALSEDEVIEHCKQNLASYKKPKSVEFTSELPRNAAGKVLKFELR